jgi:TonB family protein
MLDAAALDAVRQWKYTPATLNGNPVKVVMSVNVTFARP